MSADDLFNTVLTNLRRLGCDVQPAPIPPITTPLSRPLKRFEDNPVRLLVGPIPLPEVYTKAGHLAKRQPHPKQIGDIVYLKQSWTEGTLCLYPFSMAGTGYELVKDAREGVHFEFI